MGDLASTEARCHVSRVVRSIVPSGARVPQSRGLSAPFVSGDGSPPCAWRGRTRRDSFLGQFTPSCQPRRGTDAHSSTLSKLTVKALCVSAALACGAASAEMSPQRAPVGVAGGQRRGGRPVPPHPPHSVHPARRPGEPRLLQPRELRRRRDGGKASALRRARHLRRPRVRVPAGRHHPLAELPGPDGRQPRPKASRSLMWGRAAMKTRSPGAARRCGRASRRAPRRFWCSPTCGRAPAS